MGRTDDFERFRPLLFSIAYRILGSVEDAEDTVQEAWLRYVTAEAEPVSVQAYLTTTVTRVAIDALRAARVRREAYVGEWFPEPLLEDPYDDPARSAELADSISMTALLMLERLSPLERAVFVLHDGFGFGFAEVAAAVGRSEAACRQLAVRARRHMTEGRPRFRVDRREREELAGRFLDALRGGDVGALRKVLAPGVRSAGDGGGKAPAFARAVTGADRVARLLGAMAPALLAIGGRIEAREVNGQPGAVFLDPEGKIINTLALEIYDGRVQTILAVINPDKLRHLGPVADAWSVDRLARQAMRATG
ncbi:RNA polymerase sigma-70 factor [Bailinhaonella thermotolerans]|uniref:RNA polymerase sigma-70 factor n=1 Tax=Bailinhaonella thermotolerans TaxID=1070861 RepID=A0A3A4B6C1_9ACTN|nr:RNA polymerase sigma-70 factor [Bailinhaonella thermotolerans]RJL33074.1 RNA polymerase sigma-70 factor [Bailinhaonella thermotolerans]